LLTTLVGVVVSQQAATYFSLLTVLMMLGVAIFSGTSLWQKRLKGEGWWRCYGPFLLQQLGMFFLLVDPFKNFVVSIAKLAASPEFEQSHVLPFILRGMHVFCGAWAEQPMHSTTMIPSGSLPAGNSTCTE